MSIRVTITKPGVTDGYGIAMAVGTTCTVDDAFGLSLIQQGKATDTDSSQTDPGVNNAMPVEVVFCNAATIAAPTAQMLRSYNVEFALDVAPFTRYMTNGTALVPVGLAADSSGNLTGIPLVGAQVAYVQTGNVENTVWIGDSMVALNQSSSPTITAATRTNNVVTCTSTSHGLPDGVPITTINMVPSSFCANQVTVTRIDANTFSYPAVGGDGSAADLVASTAPMIALNLQQQSDGGAFYWLNAKTGGAYRMLHNAGANGQTAADQLARFSRDVLVWAAMDHLVIQTGYNDFARDARTAAAVYADVIAMAKRVSFSKKVTIVSAIPWSTATSVATRGNAVAYNRAIRNWCNSQPNVRFADAAKYIVDATNATRFSPLSGMLQSDNIHPSPKGAYYIAQAIYDANLDRLPRPSRLVNSNADNVGYLSTSTNIVDNAPWVNSGGATAGGASGTVCSGWGVTLSNVSTTATLVASAPARSDGIGYDQQGVFTAGGASDTMVISLSGTISGRISATQKYVVMMEMTLSGMSGASIKGIETRMGFNNSPATSAYIMKVNATAAASYPAIDGTYTLVSQEITVPTGATTVSIQTTFTVSAAGTALTAKIGRLSMESV